MKEDILEQLADEYLQSKGYFTRHNIKFCPSQDHPEFDSKKDSNHSDIDILGVHPKKNGPERVWVVSCKSWQSGFSIDQKIKQLEENKKFGGKEAWKSFRELMVPKWSAAFIRAVEDATGTRQFTYVLAVTVVIGAKGRFQQHPRFLRAIEGNPIHIITLTEMLNHVRDMSSTTVASSMIGRVLQLMKASEKGQRAVLDTIEAQKGDKQE
jgi:hypothetical protein